MTSLKVGHIAYANCVPFFHHLRDVGFAGEIVKGVPAELNSMMAGGLLDICPSSSIEYARHVDDYLLLPDHSISSCGPVQSVLLFTEAPVSYLDGVPISITGESATSVALLQVLLKEFFQLREVVFHKKSHPDGAPLLEGGATLLIGDKALKAQKEAAGRFLVIDLGELWYHYTGLPFVFGLWMVNRRSAEQKRQEVMAFARQLSESRSRAFADLAALAAGAAEKSWMGEQALVDYWQRVSYDLDPFHVEGLRCFYLLLEKHGLLEEVPEIAFFD